MCGRHAGHCPASAVVAATAGASLRPHAPDGRRNKNKGHGSAAVALEGAEGGLRVLVRHQRDADVVDDERGEGEEWKTSWKPNQRGDGFGRLMP